MRCAIVYLHSTVATGECSVRLAAYALDTQNLGIENRKYRVEVKFYCMVQLLLLLAAASAPSSPDAASSRSVTPCLI